jgi:hypothetical protein
MPIQRIGQDFIVNTTATNNQGSPSITALANGRFVVTWQSGDTGDGSAGCVRGRVYNVNGTPFDDDFVVNTTATGTQIQSCINALADGRFIVTWTSADTGDGSESCIRGRVFDDEGNAAGTDFIVNGTKPNSQYTSKMATLTDGRFVVTWASEGDDGAGTAIRARFFGASGSALGDDVIVNTTTADNQRNPSITALADGRFVMAWQSYEAGDGSGHCIRGRLYDANGTAAGDDFIVNTTADQAQYFPSITGLVDGRFVVTWSSGDGGDGASGCVRGRIFDAAGNAAGGDFIVNATTEGAQGEVAVTALADGRFIATWSSTDNGDGSGQCLRGRLYNVDGTAAGGDFVVNTTGANSQLTPSVAALPDGRFVVAWHSTDTGDGSGSCIRAQLFNPNRFDGTDGADVWQGGNLGDDIRPGDGDDMLSGLGGDDAIDGDEGNDALSGGAGADGLDGGNGDDILSGGSGGDELRGGDGIDTASYQSSGAGVTVDLAAGTGMGGDAEGDFLSLIENLTGSAFADTLAGDAGNNVLNGGAGDDTAVFTHNFEQYGAWELGSTIVIEGPDGADTLTGIEHLRFADRTLDVTDDGNLLFDTLNYLSRNPDVLQAGVNALDHYNAFGWREGRDPSDWFDTSGYLAANPDVAAAGVNPLEHYHQFGWREGRDPSVWFDTTLYLITNPDVAAAGMDPLMHYLAHGALEGREAHPAVGPTVNGFDAQYYLFQNPDVAAAGVDPLQHYNTHGWREGRNPNIWFDTAGYLSHNTDVAAAGINPFEHYMAIGWTEGRDASIWFDTRGYLADNPDVAAAGMNPLEHFLQSGIYEGRQAVNDGMWS